MTERPPTTTGATTAAVPTQEGRLRPLTFFGQGAGRPLCSVLIPTRGRPGPLSHAIDSCYSLARDKSSLEFVLRVDDDDTETLDVAERVAGVVPLRVVRGPRGRGYADMHLWVGAMAREARGDWLLFFNDDARVATQDWDVILQHTYVQGCWHPCSHDLCLLIPETNDDPQSNETILLRRRTWEILGGVGGSPYADSWLYYVTSFAGCMMRAPALKFTHERHLVQDQVRADTEGGYLRSIVTLESVGAVYARMADCLKLITHIEKVLQGPCGARPVAPGWYYWQPDHCRGMYVLAAEGIMMRFANGMGLRTRLPKEPGGRWYLRRAVPELSGWGWDLGLEVSWEDVDPASVYAMAYPITPPSPAALSGGGAASG